MGDLEGCRACRHYSAGVVKPSRHFAHKCNYHGRGDPRIIRLPVEGRAQPVDIPDWCPVRKEPDHA